jgi:hypothetical protein
MVRGALQRTVPVPRCDVGSQWRWHRVGGIGMGAWLCVMLQPHRMPHFPVTFSPVFTLSTIRAQFDDRQRMKGLPTSEEMEQAEIIRKFKEQYPEYAGATTGPRM